MVAVVFVEALGPVVEFSFPLMYLVEPLAKVSDVVLTIKQEGAGEGWLLFHFISLIKYEKIQIVELYTKTYQNVNFIVKFVTS